MAFFKVLYMISIFLVPIKGLNCPSIDDLPVMHGDVFSCAQWWKKQGSYYPVDACNGLLRFAFNFELHITF